GGERARAGDRAGPDGRGRGVARLVAAVPARADDGDGLYPDPVPAGRARRGPRSWQWPNTSRASRCRFSAAPPPSWPAACVPHAWPGPRTYARRSCTVKHTDLARTGAAMRQQSVRDLRIDGRRLDNLGQEPFTGYPLTDTDLAGLTGADHTLHGRLAA